MDGFITLIVVLTEKSVCIFPNFQITYIILLSPPPPPFWHISYPSKSGKSKTLENKDINILSEIIKICCVEGVVR